MADEFLRVLEIVAIFLGVLLRTGAPFLRKKTLADVFSMELTWVYTAIAAFGASWISILIAIPLDFDPVMRIVIAFFIAFSENSIINEMAKWKPVLSYIKTGEKPGQ